MQEIIQKYLNFAKCKSGSLFLVDFSIFTHFLKNASYNCHGFLCRIQRQLVGDVQIPLGRTNCLGKNALWVILWLDAISLQSYRPSAIT